MSAFRHHGIRAFAGLLVSAFLGVASAADSNLTNRAKEDKSAIANLALQFAQQVQAQQIANAQTLRELQLQTEKTEATIASLRRWIIGGVLVVLAGSLTVLCFIRRRPPAPPANVLIGPVSARGLLTQALALEQQGLFSDALAHYERALALDPLLPTAYLGKGRMLNQLQRYEEALECYEKATHLQGDSAPRPIRSAG